MRAAAPPAPSAQVAPGNINPWIIALAMVVPAFMEVLGTTIANVSLRYLPGSLSASATDSKYVITSYLSANAVVLPICGWLAAHLGRRRYFLLSIRSGSAFSSLLSSIGRSCSARTRNGTGLEIPLVACRHSPRSRSSAPEPYSLGESPGQPDCKLSSSTPCYEHALARSAAIALRLRRVPRRSRDVAGRNLFHHGHYRRRCLDWPLIGDFEIFEGCACKVMVPERLR